MKQQYKSSEARRAYSKRRRERMHLLQRCINGPVRGEQSQRTGRFHGPVFKAGRCYECWCAKVDADDARYWQAKARAA